MNIPVVIAGISLSAIIYQEPFTATRRLGLGLGVDSIALLSH